MSYYSFSPNRGQFGAEKHEYGSFEVFYSDGNPERESRDSHEQAFNEANVLPEGYYWRACFPGCLPDGDPCGPFETEREAIRDADGR